MVSPPNERQVYHRWQKYKAGGLIPAGFLSLQNGPAVELTFRFEMNPRIQDQPQWVYNPGVMSADQ